MQRSLSILSLFPGKDLASKNLDIFIASAISKCWQDLPCFSVFFLNQFVPSFGSLGRHYANRTIIVKINKVIKVQQFLPNTRLLIN